MKTKLNPKTKLIEKKKKKNVFVTLFLSPPNKRKLKNFHKKEKNKNKTLWEESSLSLVALETWIVDFIVAIAIAVASSYVSIAVGGGGEAGIIVTIVVWMSTTTNNRSDGCC